MLKSLLLVFVAVVAGLAVYKMVFSPVSITFESHPGKILTNSSTLILVEVFPLNRLGFKIPFDRLDGRFVVNEGGEKIDIVQEKKDMLIFRTGDSVGRVVILYYTNSVPYPVEIILDIETATLAIIDHRSLSFG